MNLPQNIYADNLALEKADSSFDHRSRFVDNVLYDLPFAKETSGWVRAIAATTPFFVGHSSGLVIHTTGDPHQYLQGIRAAVHRLDPDLAVASVETMNEHPGFAFYPAA